MRAVGLLVVALCVSRSIHYCLYHLQKWDCKSSFASAHALEVSRGEGCVEVQPMVQGREVEGRGDEAGNV